MRLIRLTILFVLVLFFIQSCKQSNDSLQNLALVAEPSVSVWGPWANSLNDGLIPADSIDRRLSRRLRQPDSQWVQYSWQQPVTTSEMVVYLWDYHGEIPFPETCTVSYWDGDVFVPLKRISRNEMMNNRFDTIRFDEIQTTRLRLEADSALMLPANLLEWEVHQHPGSHGHPPVVNAGIDRDVMVDGKTYLSGDVRSASTSSKVSWSMESGPGRVRFEDKKALEGTVTFSRPGDYILKLTAADGSLKSSSTVNVKVHTPPQVEKLEVVHTTPYRIDNHLWEDRLKAVIVNWIPHCIDQINTPAPEVRTGGIDNFIEAAKALRGEPHGRHIGYVFSNAWVLQIIESMSLALMVDSKGDQEIIAAQEKMRETLEDWIPKVLAAQEPDGYLQTAYTLRNPDYIPPAAGSVPWETRWQPEHRRAHEGYVAGYFLESSIAHHTYSQGKDTRMYDAAKRLADCWIENIGPGKIEWWDGHQGIKMALIRFGRYVNEVEAPGSGTKYIELAKFLADNRDGGHEYDQSHVPVQMQYEAVGHAVRATYSYAGMAGIATETGDTDYYSAVMSLWNNLVNRKYYVTGGIGSGETSEGFGPNYSLRHNAYNESCSSCGLMFFQHNMNSTYHEAKYADLMEETMYNALLGSLDLEGKNFYYTNPLTQKNMRYPWHGCPCCVGNIPRTLLMLPTWAYQKSNDGIYINLFIGSSMNIKHVAGTDIEIIQESEYPKDGKVTIILNPEQPAEFSVYVRIPNRKTSKLYSPVPEVNGYSYFALNNTPSSPDIENGYIEIKRKWEKGDRIDLELPMEIQQITSDEMVEANRGMVALRYGPLIYNVERYDNQDVTRAIGDSRLFPEWRDDLLNGIMTIRGEWEDGTPLLAIPHYTRANRADGRENEDPVHSVVWINKK